MEQVECKGRRAIFKSYVTTLPNGAQVRVDKVVFPDSVAVLPVYRGPQWEVVLLRQYRPSIDKWIIEAPAGTLKPGESPYEAAIRELEEETGLRAESLVEVGGGYLAPGYSTEYMKLYLAFDPERGRSSPESHEVLEPFKTTLDEALRMVSRGEIGDIKTITLLLAARQAQVGGL